MSRCKTPKQQKRLCKMCIKTKLYVTQIFEYNIAAIRKRKVALKLNKSAYDGMRILELTKVLKYEFHYDYIKNKYHNKSKPLLTDLIV